jgi:putative transposase
MARPLRLEFPGALYHVTSRGDGREDIYVDDADREEWLDVLGEACGRFNWMVHAYCLMTNHYHVLLETPDGNLSRGMRQLNGVYTQRFNRAHGRVGHVFQGRYKAVVVQKDAYLMELARYIVVNPVRARMVRSAREWPWSSYRATAGQEPCPAWLSRDWLLAAFGPTLTVAETAYREFVSQGRWQPSPWEKLKNQVSLGSDQFVEQMQGHLKPDRDLSEIPLGQKRGVARPLKEYERLSGSRDEAIVAAYASGGYTMKEIGAHFGRHYSRVSRLVKDPKAKRKA